MFAYVRRKRVPPWNSQWGLPDRRWRFTSTCAVILTLLANSVVPTTGFADNDINFNMEVDVSWNKYQKVTESATATASGSSGPNSCHNSETKLFGVNIPFQQDVILNKDVSASKNCKSRSVKYRQVGAAWTELANEHTLNNYEGQLEFEIYSANDRYHLKCRTCNVTAKATFFGGTPTPQSKKYGPYPSSIPYTQEKQELLRILEIPVSQSKDVAIPDVQCHAFSTDNQNVNLSCERVGNEFIVYATSKIIPPVASLKLSPTSGVAPLTVKLEGSGSYDPDGITLNYDWTASDGQNHSGSENELTWIFDQGKHDVCLVVTDSDNLQDKKCQTVLVDVCSSDLEPKTFNEFGKQRGGAQVHVSASAEECTWKIESNRDWLIIGSNPYKGSQTLNFSLTNNSSTEPRCGNLTLAKKPPVKICQKGNQKPIADFTIHRIEPSQDNHAPLTVKLDAIASTDPDGPISSYRWNHGGQLLSQLNEQATILYDKEGDYTITLTVKDEEGATATQSKPIKVLPPLYTLIVKSTDNGRVKVDHAEECTPPSCTKTYPKDTLVNLKAIPSTGSIFTGWTEDCSHFANAPSCHVQMTQPLSVMANFKQCDYQIEGSKTEQFNANLHQGTIKIISPNGCQWQAESNQPDWLSIEGDSHGNGNGTIQYSVKLNPNQTVRDATITIKRESQTRETFSVNQTGNQPPTASFTATPLEGKAPLTVFLNATESTDPENNRIDRYEWTSSDKQPLSGATPQISYPNAGRYTINLVVVDESGIASSNTAQETINVGLPTYTLTVSSIGSGTVKGNGIDCGHNCSREYDQGASVILTAEANSDAVFSAWNGCSSNTIPTSCEVSMTQPQTVTASFTSCYDNYTITSTDNIHYNADGGHGNMNVSAPKGCPWDAKTDKEWLTITSGFNGNGEGHITYSLDPNNDNEKREGKLILAGKTFIIIQQGREYENLVIKKVGDGKGRVIGAGIDCGDDCDEQYAQDTAVTLTARPSDEAIFEGWGGPCTVNETICTVKMSQTQTVIARFISKPFLKVIIDGTGTGHVSLEPVETRHNCYKTDKVCRNAYDKNTPVTLTANHAADSQFVGWNGDCSGITETCSVSLDKTKIVTATFNRLEGGPEACFTFSYSETPLTIEAEAETRCHEDREIADYQWETSDGQSGTGQTIRLTFEKQGKYTLTLKVTDEMGEGTSTQTIIFDEQLVFVRLKPFYKLDEKLEVDLIENLEVDNRFERVDLWVAVQLPDNRFLFRVPSIKEPFSSEGKAFRSSLELEDKTHRILDFTVSPGLGGNYTLYAVYVQEGKNPIDDLGVIKSNFARATTVLSNR